MEYGLELQLPGRLDLNNTYANETSKWVYLPPHANTTDSFIFSIPVQKRFH